MVTPEDAFSMRTFSINGVDINDSVTELQGRNRWNNFLKY